MNKLKFFWAAICSWKEIPIQVFFYTKQPSDVKILIYFILKMLGKWFYAIALYLFFKELVFFPQYILVFSLKINFSNCNRRSEKSFVP